ncbi:MAG: hypothetical protein PHG66_06055 [Candidatus Colwellbacteria bacterium]|nr:hypothetical protein [Candidatus Colwellbacteria bacterium]
MNKKIIYWIIAIAIIVIVGLSAWWWLSQSKLVQAPANTPETQQEGTPLVGDELVPADTVVAIDASLDGIDVGDIDKEFKEIDQSIGDL